MSNKNDIENEAMKRVEAVQEYRERGLVIIDHVIGQALVSELRIQVDETPEFGGALRVIPGSHRQGRLSNAEIQRMRRNDITEVCPVGVGGAMIMSPHLVHASSPAQTPSHRRVLHFEFTATDLPGGPEWAC